MLVVSRLAFHCFVVKLFYFLSNEGTNEKNIFCYKKLI